MERMSAQREGLGSKTSSRTPLTYPFGYVRGVLMWRECSQTRKRAHMGRVFVSGCGEPTTNAPKWARQCSDGEEMKQTRKRVLWGRVFVSAWRGHRKTRRTRRNRHVRRVWSKRYVADAQKGICNVSEGGGVGEGVRGEEEDDQTRRTRLFWQVRRVWSKRHVADALMGVCYVYKRWERPPNTKTRPNGRVFDVRRRGTCLGETEISKCNFKK